MKEKAFFLISLIMFSLTVLTEAEERQYIFRSIDVDYGLSQNSVMDIIQDRTGFIWFGTKDGLNRYDGLEIRRFSPVNAIPGNEYITSLCEDDSGNIWIGTSAGICIYFPAYEKEERFLESTSDGMRINGNVGSLQKSPSGEIWGAVQGTGFFKYDISCGELAILKSDASGNISYEKAGNLCFNAKGGCYADTGDGNIYISEDGLATLKPMLDSPEFKNRKINKMAILYYSKLFICTVQGLFCINLSSGEIDEIDLGMERFLHVHDIINMPDGEIWVGTDTGIVILGTDMRVKRYLLPEWGDFNSPKDISTYSFCLDREGGLWTGTYFGGAGYYPKDYTHIKRYYPISYSEHFGQRVREIVPAADGTLWVGTEDRGLVHFFPESGKYIPVRHPYISDNVHGLCLDGKYLWIGTYDRYKGLIRYDTETGRVKRYPSAGYEIYSICRKNDGTLLLGTTCGLKIYCSKTDRFVADSSVNVHINDIFQDSSGNLWIATNTAGVYVQDALSSEWKHFRYEETDTSSLAADMALSIFEDSRSRIWISTQGGGVCRYIAASDSFERYFSQSGIPYSTVYRIEEDDRGSLWLTTNNGLVMFNENTGVSSVFTVEDGLLSNQFNYSSSCMDSTGRIWAGCIKGLISFRPSAITDDTYVPPVVFTSFSIYNKPVEIGGHDSPLDKSITLADRLDLSASQSTFSIKAAMINFRSPRQKEMYYMLEGYDHEWYPVLNNTISYTRLSPGKYTLKISGGREKTSVKELEIRVRPPFYLSTWAFILYVVGLAALSLYIYKRTRQKQAETLERMEQEKIRELYVAKFDFFTSIAHEIRTPLSLISGPLESMKKDLVKNDKAALDEDLNMISQNAGRLTELINQLLDFRKAEQGGFVPNMSVYDIPALVKDVFGKFSGASRHSGIKMSLILPEKKFTAVVDREAMVKIISNMLSNAVKYAKNFAILELKLDKPAGEFRIILSNDGKIIPADMREKIFQPFVQYINTCDAAQAGTGIGLSLARSLAELHRGSLKMDSDHTVNRFICTIPLPAGTATIDTPPISQTQTDTGGTKSDFEGTTGRKSVLIVEDNRDMQSFIARQLAEIYGVNTASDGMEAKSILEKEGCQFDLVISDVMMPRMDGFVLCEWIKKNLQTSHIPVVLLTAKTDMGSKITGLGYGADFYIEKPFSVAYLMTSISNILENRERLKRHFAASPFGSALSLLNSKTDEKFLSDLDSYISEHIEDPKLSVSDLADAACMSPSNLFRKLKGAVGMAPVEYLQLQRLKKAAALLLEQKYTIAEVSLMSGFNSNTYFTLCFKKQFGCTPSTFIKNNKK